ncbi:MAG: YigZ family protein [Lentisphaerae bacterium]|nr:YigZ family protein [Lentisphaerota bacterium]
MFILKQAASAETRVKNSRFLAEVFPVSSPEEAKAAWRFRKENYDNGGHIVYAFTIGNQQNISGCSDDGEPSGTAGKPVLAVLTGSGLTNAMITIARWFGGTKLGTGGLVHAYSDAAKAALANAEFTELVPMAELDLTLPYNLYNTLISKTSALGAEVIKEEFNSEISLTLSIKSAQIGELEKVISETGNGKISFTVRK